MNYWAIFRGKMKLRRGMVVEAQLFYGSTKTKVCDILYPKGDKWVVWCEEDQTEYLVENLTIKRVFITDQYRKDRENEHREYMRKYWHANNPPKRHRNKKRTNTR